MEISPSVFSLFPLPVSEFESKGLGFGLVSDPFSEPELSSLSTEPGSLEPSGSFTLVLPEAGFPNAEVHAVMSRSRRMCATARSSV